MSFFRCFARYPRHIADRLKSTFPEGYSIERNIYFENDGWAKAYHEVWYEDGEIRSTVQVDGYDFKEDGHIMRKNLGTPLPVVLYVAPTNGDELRSVGYGVSKLIKPSKTILLQDVKTPQ